MSTADDIRMYVEHLFEGRTLTAETIELKEEIYGNLMARYEDYRAQGMNEAEAYAKTCAAVTSVDDVLDGEKDMGAADCAAEDTVPDVEKTVVAPVVGATAEDAGPDVSSAASETAGAKRWTPGKIALVAVAIVAAVFILGFAACAALGMVQYQAVVQQNSEVLNGDPEADAVETIDDSTAYDSTDANAGSIADGSSDGVASDVTNTGTAAKTLTTDGLDQALLAHDPRGLTEYADLSWNPLPDAKQILELYTSLPMSEYLSGCGVSAEWGNPIMAEYAWVEDERVAYVNDDAYERAIVYNAVATLCAVPDAEVVKVTLHETDGEDGDVDVESFFFQRDSLEQLLGVELTTERLTDGSWDGLRDQIMLERVYDEAWDRAELD